jgi:hypothetical protein
MCGLEHHAHPLAADFLCLYGCVVAFIRHQQFFPSSAQLDYLPSSARLQEHPRVSLQQQQPTMPQSPHRRSSSSS